MLFPLALLSGFQKLVPTEPRLVGAWSSVAATGLDSATIRITTKKAGGPTIFEMSSRATKGGPETILRGLVENVSLPKEATDVYGKDALGVRFLYDFASLRKVGVEAKEIAALKAKGTTHETGMRLFFVPSVPMLTDLMSATFLPAAKVEREAAKKRLKDWKPGGFSGG